MGKAAAVKAAMTPPCGQFLPRPQQSVSVEYCVCKPQGKHCRQTRNQPKENFSVTSMIQSLTPRQHWSGSCLFNNRRSDPPVITEKQFNRRTILGNNRLTQKSVLTQKVLSKCVCVCALACGQERRLGREGGNATKWGSVHTMTQVCAWLSSKFADSKIFLVCPGEGRTHL